MAEIDLIDVRTDRKLRLLSVVAPMFNEEGTAALFYERVVNALDGIPFEIVLVDDASKDGTGQIIDDLADRDPRVRVLRLSRNFGHQAALTAGLEHARGDAVAMLDGDLQDPPELIVKMLDEWHRGADVVYAVRNQRAGESWFKLTTASWFYRLFARLSKLELEGNSGDFRLLDRRALDSLLQMRERNRFLRGMTVWVGFTQTAVGYDRDPRQAGETKYTLRKMLKFSLDAISSFSWLPLQAATFVGFVVTIIAFLGLPFAIVSRIVGWYAPGVSALMFVVLLIGGIQLITVGIIGEYVGRIYDEVKGRPLYLVRESRNFDQPPEAAPSAADEQIVTR
jgi:glycosyltransferase involved in cell wall biosynthesis